MITGLIRPAAFASALLLSLRLASAATVYVATTGNDSNDGSMGSPKLTLAGAYAITTTNDTISVAPGTYAGGLSIAKPLTLVSESGPLNTIIANAGTGNGLTISSTGVRVEGFTISNATYGIACSGGNVAPSKVVRCIIRNNTSHGVLINGGKLVLQLFSCLVIRNGGTGYRSQGVDNASPPAIILQSTIAFNGGDGYYDNHKYTCQSYIANSIIANNAGVGINRAYNTGATDSYNSGLGLTRCLVANNAGGDFSSVNENHKIGFGGVSLTADPRFMDAAADNFTLSAASPALKHGGPAVVAHGTVNYTSEYDLVGAAFSATGANDLGCYASASAAPAKLGTVHVDGALTDPGDGSEEYPFRSLGDGLAFTAPGGTCYVASATYTGTYFVGSSQVVAGAGLETTQFSNGWYALFFAGNDSRVMNVTAGARLGAVQTTGLRSALVQSRVIRGKYGVVVTGQPVLLDRVAISNITENGVHAVAPNNDGTWNAWVKLVSCLITSNKVGIYCNWDYGGKGSLHLYNTTIAGNTSHGINRNHYATHSYAWNSIVAFNGGAGYQAYSWGGASDYMYNCAIFGNTLGNTVRAGSNPGSLVFNAAMVTADPRFIAGGYRLAPGSLCLQAGLNVAASGVSHDLDGNAWTLPYDMGCYDSPYTPPVKVADSYADAVTGSDTNDGASPATAKRLIADAIGVTLSNGTCHVAAGTYTESFAIPDTISVIGTNRELTRIESVGGYTVSMSSGSVLRAVSILGGARGINIAAHNNWVEDVTVDGASGDGVHVYGKNVILTNCTVRNTGGIGINVPANGLARHTLISRCIISNNASHGLYTSGNPSPTVWIENSLVAANRGAGLFINGDGATVGTNGVFYCTVADNAQQGIVFDYVYGLRHELYNSIVAGNGLQGVVRSNVNGTTWLGGVLAARNGGADYSFGASPWTIGWMVTSTLLQHSPDLQADYTPGPASAALGAACVSPRPAPGLDLAGNPRPASGADLGCYHTGLPAPATVRYAATYADPARPDNTGDGLSWETAKREPAEALALTAPGGTCHLAAGAYSNSLLPDAGITLMGAGPTNTVRFATGTDVGLYIPPYASNCVVRGIGFRGGTAGLIVDGNDAMLDDCTVAIASQCGIINRGAHRMLVDRCVVEDCGQDGLATMLGVYRSLTVSRSLFARNSRGINLADIRVNPVIENCIVFSNRLDGIYVAIDNVYAGTNLFQHNTVFCNASNGLWIDTFYNQRGTCQNNLIVSNQFTGLKVTAHPSGILHHGANLSYGHTNGNISISGLTAVLLAPNLELDPQPLRPDYAPAKGTPAFNAALPSPLMVDYYGRPRPLYNHPDIGAVENNQPSGTLMMVQ